MDFPAERFWSRHTFLSLCRNVLPRDMPSQSRPAWVAVCMGNNVKQGIVDLRKYGTDRRDLEQLEFRDGSLYYLQLDIHHRLYAHRHLSSVYSFHTFHLKAGPWVQCML